MKTEIKDKLILKLKQKGDSVVTGEYPIIKVLTKILSELHPSISFNNLESSSVVTKPKGYSTDWDNVRKYSGLERIDFYLKNHPDLLHYTKNKWDEDKQENIPVPVKTITRWMRSSLHPTIGSVIYANSLANNKLSYSKVADIIEKDYVI